MVENIEFFQLYEFKNPARVDRKSSIFKFTQKMASIKKRKLFVKINLLNSIQYFSIKKRVTQL